MRKIDDKWDGKDYFIEEWTLGDNDWEGIRVHDSDVLDDALEIARTNKFFLGGGHFCGYVFEDRVYNHESWFYNGCVFVRGMMKENVKLLKGFPEGFLRIGADGEDKIKETIGMLKLPFRKDC